MIPKIKVLFFLCFLSSSLILSAQSISTNKQIDSLLNYLKDENAFSGSVAIQKGKKTIYEGDFNKFPNGTNKYRVGSVTKIYTALIIYQLIDEGKLAINTKLENYFPEIKNSNLITIDNLLSHTSGIYNITDWEDYYSTRNKSFTQKEIVTIITQHKPAFKPNSDCSYSNTNYILLGYIIEDVTKKSYQKNVQERISNTFNLSNTYCETNNSNRLEREQSYKFNGETWSKDTDSDPSLPFAAGAMVSTPSEMCQLMYHLFNKEIISDSSLATMKKLKSKSIGHGLFKAPFMIK